MMMQASNGNDSPTPVPVEPEHTEPKTPPIENAEDDDGGDDGEDEAAPEPSGAQ